MALNMKFKKYDTLNNQRLHQDVLVVSTKGESHKRYAFMFARRYDSRPMLQNTLHYFDNLDIEHLDNPLGMIIDHKQSIHQSVIELYSEVDDIQILIVDIKRDSGRKIQKINSYRLRVKDDGVTDKKVVIQKCNLIDVYLNAFVNIDAQINHKDIFNIKSTIARLWAYLFTFYKDWGLYEDLNMSYTNNALIVPSTQEFLNDFLVKSLTCTIKDFETLPSPTEYLGSANYKLEELMRAMNLCEHDIDESEDDDSYPSGFDNNSDD